MKFCENSKNYLTKGLLKRLIFSNCLKSMAFGTLDILQNTEQMVTLAQFNQYFNVKTFKRMIFLLHLQINYQTTYLVTSCCNFVLITLRTCLTLRSDYVRNPSPRRTHTVDERTPLLFDNRVVNSCVNSGVNDNSQEIKKVRMRRSIAAN